MLLAPMLIVALFRVRPLLTRSMPWALARSRPPLRVTASKKLLPELEARKLPVPTAVTAPLIVMPFCTTLDPAPARIWLPTLP